MITITLSNNEFVELTQKAEAYDKLVDTIVDSYKVQVEEDSSWRPVQIDIRPEWPKEITGRIVQTIAAEICKSGAAMDYIIDSGDYILDLDELRLDDMPYNERLCYGQYNLLEVSEPFSTEYEGRKIEKELQLEEKKKEAEKQAEEAEPEEEPKEEPEDVPVDEEPTVIPKPEEDPEPTEEPEEEPTEEPVDDTEESEEE